MTTHIADLTTPALSTPAMSTLTISCRYVHSCIVHSRKFSVPLHLTIFSAHLSGVIAA